jgi:hypothetical protein
LDPRGVALCQPGLREAERLVLGDAPPDPRDWLTPVDEEGVRSAAHQAPPPEEIPAVEDEDQ